MVNNPQLTKIKQLLEDKFIPQNQQLVLIVAAIAQAHVTIHVKQAAAEHAIGRVEEVAIIVVQEIV